MKNLVLVMTLLGAVGSNAQTVNLETTEEFLTHIQERSSVIADYQAYELYDDCMEKDSNLYRMTWSNSCGRLIEKIKQDITSVSLDMLNFITDPAYANALDQLENAVKSFNLINAPLEVREQYNHLLEEIEHLKKQQMAYVALSSGFKQNIEDNIDQLCSDYYWFKDLGRERVKCLQGNIEQGILEKISMVSKENQLVPVTQMQNYLSKAATFFYMLKNLRKDFKPKFPDVSLQTKTFYNASLTSEIGANALAFKLKPTKVVGPESRIVSTHIMDDPNYIGCNFNRETMLFDQNFEKTVNDLQERLVTEGLEQSDLEQGMSRLECGIHNNDYDLQNTDGILYMNTLGYAGIDYQESDWFHIKRESKENCLKLVECVKRVEDGNKKSLLMKEVKFHIYNESKEFEIELPKQCLVM